MTLTPDDAAQLVETLQTDAQKLHDVVNGDAASTVATDNGPVPTLAKKLAEMGAALSGSLSAVSDTALTIGLGAKVFSIEAEKLFASGQLVLAVDAADAGNWMFGSVDTYVGTYFTVDVTDFGGGGSISDWLISVTGLRGAVGATGPGFTINATGLDGDLSDYDAEAAGFTYLASDSSLLYVRETAVAGVWSSGIPFGKGDDGDSAYEIAVAAGYGGDKTAWLASLKGTDGIDASGDVVGPATNANNKIAIWDGTNSKTLKDSGVALADKQDAAANLATLAALTLAANKMLYATGAGALALTTLSAFARTLLDDADAATMRTTLGAASPSDISTAIANLVASSPAALDTLNELAAALGDDPNFATTMTNALAGKQASNANLTALAGLALAANKMVYATGTGALGLATLSTFMRGLLGSASATALQVNMGVRQLLLSIKTIYVSTTGSDSTGDGSISTPYATINKAFSVISQTLDTAGFAVTIQLFGGTYTDSVGVIPSWVGGGQIIISGNEALPSSVILTSSISTGVINVINPGHVKVQYLKLQSTVGNCLTTKGSGSKLTVGAGVNFGTCAGIQMQADAQSTLNRENSYTISGGALIHEAATGGVINTTSGITITGVGTIAYSVRYAQAVLLGVLNNAGPTWSGGTFTGQKYFCGSGAVIFTNTGDINYFPGSTAGLTSGGYYI